MRGLVPVQLADELRLHLEPRQRAGRHELDPGRDDETIADAPLQLRREPAQVALAGAVLGLEAQRRVDAGPRGVEEDLEAPVTRGCSSSTTSLTAEGQTFTPATISMSSVRPTQTTLGPVRPHAHGDVPTVTRSPTRKRTSGTHSRVRWVATSSPSAPSSHSRPAPVSGSTSSMKR